MKKLPIGLQNFKEIIEDGYLYVDKTRQIYDLVDKGKLYFLSRPRRFGKSLLLTTLRYIFDGEKDLFEGLYIAEKTDYTWKQHPVLQFNFAAYGHEYEPDELEGMIRRELQRHSERFDIKLSEGAISEQLRVLVEQISKKHNSVVLLLDEYDKPIVDFLTKPEKAAANRAVLREFFSPLKDLDSQKHLRFLFITGVSKFSKVSLFSDLNNLQDITIDPLGNDLLGITHDELLEYFDNDYIQPVTEHFKTTKEDLLKNIKLWYNGYSYDGITKLYNPFSLLNFFAKKRFGNFWFATGTPTFLVETIRDTHINPQELEEVEVNDAFFDKFSLESLDMSGLLFQTGYLTIKRIEYQEYLPKYYLGYPNMEVHRALIHNLLEAFTYKVHSIVNSAVLRIQRALEQGDVKLFIKQLEILFADISYHLHPKKNKSEEAEFKMWEGYFQTIIYLITSFIGLFVESEITKHKGRLDLTVETEKFLYLMEFKLDEPTENAIQQIKNRDYVKSYANSPKTIYLVGIGFSKTERNVAAWEAEILER